MSSGSAPRKGRKMQRARPAFVAVSPEMRRISALLGEELSRFPDVTTRPMFGFAGYYRDGVIFAALPRTRAMHSTTSFIFKLNSAPEQILDRARQDRRISISAKRLAGWQRFEIASETDIAGATQWLTEAWRWAVKGKRPAADSRG